MRHGMNAIRKSQCFSIASPSMRGEKSPSMFNRGRDQHTQQYQDARYRLRKGMAKVALRHKLGAHQARDAHGHPLRAVEMAERHSTHTLQGWANGYSTVTVMADSIRPRVMSNADRMRLGLALDPELDA